MLCFFLLLLMPFDLMPRPNDVKLPRNVQYPGRGTIYDYYFDKATFGTWHPWEKSVTEDRIAKDAKVEALHVPSNF